MEKRTLNNSFEQNSNLQRNRKRSADDDFISYSSSSSSSTSQSAKRIRYEFENQPARSLILRTSLASTWDQPSSHSDIYHRTNGNEHLTSDFSRFLFDSKQSTAAGNVSPAHSDSSTSTCSSDEQLHFHQTQQPWRTYRERENYEQLLDLAEKLADPNRFNQVNIDKFVSYRYQISIFNSKQTACVICMSHFKHNQHIRVLPCQHEYHSKCIARWFTMNSSCPICRRDNFL